MALTEDELKAIGSLMDLKLQPLVAFRQIDKAKRGPRARILDDVGATKATRQAVRSY